LLPSALVVGAASVIGVIVSRWGKERAASHISRALLTSVAVLLLLWALPLAEQLTRTPGNISQLWTFFVSESHPGQRFASAFSAWSDMLVGLLRPDFVVASGIRFRESPILWVEALAAVQMLGLIVTIALAVKARRGFVASLATLLLLVSLLTLWS